MLSPAMRRIRPATVISRDIKLPAARRSVNNYSMFCRKNYFQHSECHGFAEVFTSSRPLTCCKNRYLVGGGCAVKWLAPHRFARQDAILHPKVGHGRKEKNQGFVGNDSGRGR